MNNIKNLRLEKGYNMKQAALALNIPYTTYVSYEKGSREPSNDMLIKIADFYQTTVDYVLANSNIRTPVSANLSSLAENILPIENAKKIPLLGTIACGEPILAKENIEYEVDVPAHIRADFALRCKGNSMIGARIYDGDIVYIRKQPDVESGEIAAVLIGDEATLKRVYKYSDTVVLRPENPLYEELVYKKEEINKIKILGKAIGFCADIK